MPSAIFSAPVRLPSCGSLQRMRRLRESAFTSMSHLSSKQAANDIQRMAARPKTKVDSPQIGIYAHPEGE